MLSGHTVQADVVLFTILHIVGICYITNNLQKIWDVPKFYVKQQITELSISRIYKTKAHKTNIYISYSKHMDSNDTLFLEKKSIK